MRRKASWYPSDFSDALHPQCLSAVLYIYLATVTNAITLGDCWEKPPTVLRSAGRGERAELWFSTSQALCPSRGRWVG